MDIRPHEMHKGDRQPHTASDPEATDQGRSSWISGITTSKCGPYFKSQDRIFWKILDYVC